MRARPGPALLSASFPLSLPFSNASVRDACVVPEARPRFSELAQQQPSGFSYPSCPPAAAEKLRPAPRKGTDLTLAPAFVLQSAVKNTGEGLLLHSKGRKHGFFKSYWFVPTKRLLMRKGINCNCKEGGCF